MNMSNVEREKILQSLPLERRILNELFMKMQYFQYSPSDQERLALSQCQATVYSSGGLGMVFGGAGIWMLGRIYPRFRGFPYIFTLLSTSMAGFYVGGTSAAPACISCLQIGNTPMASEVRTIARRMDPSSLYARNPPNLDPTDQAPPIMTPNRLAMVYQRMRAQGGDVNGVMFPFPVEQTVLDEARKMAEDGEGVGGGVGGRDQEEGGQLKQQSLNPGWFDAPSQAEQLPSQAFQDSFEAQDPWEAKQKAQQQDQEQQSSGRWR